MATMVEILIPDLTILGSSVQTTTMSNVSGTDEIGQSPAPNSMQQAGQNNHQPAHNHIQGAQSQAYLPLSAPGTDTSNMASHLDSFPFPNTGNGLSQQQNMPQSHQQQYQQPQAKKNSTDQSFKKLERCHPTTKQEVDRASIRVVVKELWRTIKFVNNYEELRKVAEKAMKIMQLNGHDPDKAEDKIRVEKWLKENQSIVLECLNQYRRECAERMKRACYAYMESNRGTLPSSQEIRACALRRVSSVSEKSHFMWYWDHLVPCVAGKKYWGPATRHYQLMKTAVDPENNNKYFVPPSTEAFVVVSYENFHRRWTLQYQWYKENPGQKWDKELEFKEQSYRPLYSDSYRGGRGSDKKNFGGWSTTGKNQFIYYKEMIAAARIDPRSSEVESDCLKSLRIKYKIDAEINYNDEEVCCFGDEE